jgi:HK97 family phage prohead protease
MSDIETRTADAKSTDSSTGVTLVGRPIVYNSATTIAGSFVERIATGAFRNAIKNYDVRALFSHSYENVLGRVSAGTLRLAEDDRGVTCEIDLPGSRDDLAELIGRRDITGMSFSFIPLDQEWDYPSVGLPTRTIIEADLYEVSIVAEPQYEETSVYIRSAAFSREAARARMRMKLRQAQAFH